jgi:PadR family transcriptional regulator, regulatory protein PadR
MQPLHGLLDMLVLRTLLAGPLHGYGIQKAIHATSRHESGLKRDALAIEFGSLYPALKRIEMKGWIASKWETSDFNKRAKYYRLTPAGRKRLRDEHAEWNEFAAAVGRVMAGSPVESA